VEELKTEKTNAFFTFADIALTFLYNLTKLLTYVVPPQLPYLMLKGLGYLIFYSRPGMRRRLTAKISEALPEITDRRELDRIGREVCGSFFLAMLDFATLGRHGDRILRELKIEGMENLENAKSSTEGGVILTGVHIGWIAVIHAFAWRLGIGYTPIVFNPKDTSLPHYVGSMELDGFFLGSDPEAPAFFAGADTSRKVKEHIRKGKSVGLAFDVDGNSVVDFFGRPAALASGVAHFAYDTGAPIVPFALFRGTNVFENRLAFYPPIFPDPEAERKGELKRLLQEVVKAGEKTIREEPSQWMSWFGLWQWWDKAQKILDGEGKKD
jgi:lauroyl/myristoyl acyltransferase